MRLTTPLAAEAGRAGLLVLRSFGKFYGLAGLRLGVMAGDAAKMRGDMARHIGAVEANVEVSGASSLVIVPPGE